MDETYALYNKSMKGVRRVPGDKSISHRALIFGAIAEGRTVIKNFLSAEDCLSTKNCLRALGVEINEKGTDLIIEGKGLNGLQPASKQLDAGNSGTTARLLSGILAAQPFETEMTGDLSLQKRPMDRVFKPLEKMGAAFRGEREQGYLPVRISGSELSPIDYKMPVASAQVKSAILLAGLFTKGETRVEEQAATRDHTERMIRSFGGKLLTGGPVCTVSGGNPLSGTEVAVPGDMSSAAFLAAAALLAPDSEITIPGVGLNPGRTGFIEIIKKMGAAVEIKNRRTINREPRGDIHVQSSDLEGTVIDGQIMPRLIDEIPILALLATRARGNTVIKDAAELKIKETNRIRTVTEALSKLGASVTETEDGMIIEGNPELLLNGGQADSRGDHRIGMMLGVAAFISENPVTIKGAEAINISFPGYKEMLEI